MASGFPLCHVVERIKHTDSIIQLFANWNGYLSILMSLLEILANIGSHFLPYPLSFYSKVENANIFISGQKGIL